MIIYCVSITIDAGIESEWIDWMKRIHVPDVVRTGCFSECRIYKVIDSDGTDPSYVMQYHCPSLQEYHRYRDNFAADLQKEHSDKFAGRFRGVRQLLEEVAQATRAGRMKREGCKRSLDVGLVANPDSVRAPADPPSKRSHQAGVIGFSLRARHALGFIDRHGCRHTQTHSAPSPAGSSGDDRCGKAD